MTNLNQTGIVTAILTEITKQNPELLVIPRQFNSIIIAANRIVREFSIPEKMSSSGMGISAWRDTDQVGVSSGFMASILGEGGGNRRYGHPHDPFGFGRCLSLLDAAPELRERLPLMREQSDEWKALVDNWEELESLWEEESPSGTCPKMYDRMKEILSDADEQTAV